MNRLGVVSAGALLELLLIAELLVSELLAIELATLELLTLAKLLVTPPPVAELCVLLAMLLALLV